MPSCQALELSVSPTRPLYPCRFVKSIKPLIRTSLRMAAKLEKAFPFVRTHLQRVERCEDD